MIELLRDPEPSTHDREQLEALRWAPRAGRETPNIHVVSKDLPYDVSAAWPRPLACSAEHLVTLAGW